MWGTTVWIFFFMFFFTFGIDFYFGLFMVVRATVSSEQSQHGKYVTETPRKVWLAEQYEYSEFQSGAHRRIRRTQKKTSTSPLLPTCYLDSPCVFPLWWMNSLCSSLVASFLHVYLILHTHPNLFFMTPHSLYGTHCNFPRLRVFLSLFCSI